jgi:glycosyltransferase involved in cell wall biosynthesis
LTQAAGVRLGIGIVTYNRRDLLVDTIEKVRRMTLHPDTLLAIADDGSTDGTLQMLRDRDLPVVTGVNMGIAWNKNRALYLLGELLNCDVVLLLEDDTQPARAGWEAEWIAATQRHGHINYAGPWMRERFMSGKGTAADPIRSSIVTAQCGGFSSASLRYGGYYDSRFRGYGHEHVEHTARLIRVGYGGADEVRESGNQIVFYLIHGDLAMVDTPSFENAAEVERNWHIANELMGDQTYRAPWRDRAELRQFRGEMEGAMGRHPQGYRLAATPPGRKPSWVRRLFGK